MLFVGFSISIFCGCTFSNKYEKDAWIVAENSQTNQNELIEFLSYYKQADSREKYEAACFLIKNLPFKFGVQGNGFHIYDKDIIKSDSLKASLEYSFQQKEKSPFLKKYSLEQFFEYILPYRICSEPLEYYWKWDIPKHFKVESSDIIEAAKSVDSQINIDISSNSYGDIPQSYTSLIRNQYGKCDDRAMLVVMVLRALGIPSAYEFVPNWGNSNNGHSFATVILPDGGTYPLVNTKELFTRKIPKVYRKMYAQMDGIECHRLAPDLFAWGDLMDVTSSYPIDSRSVRIKRKDKSVSPSYLSVFSPEGWIPIAKSATDFFDNVGTGKGIDGNQVVDSECFGNGILYLPITWNNGAAKPIGNPILVSNQECKTVLPVLSSTEKVVLKRKYPLTSRMKDYAKLMLSGEFEGANHSDFSDAEQLYSITEVPESKMQYVRIDTHKRYRYIRYKRSEGTFSVAEIAIKGKDGTNLPFQLMMCEALQEEDGVKNIFDEDPLTYFQTGGWPDLWVGCDLKRPVEIGAIGFAPRNDDNAISSCNTYELFYWDDVWVSLGKQVAQFDSLVYQKVPKNAILWLRNLTRGKEERPFTYENKKQIWW